MEGTTTLAVHRCRFVDFSPSSVTALAFPPLPLLSTKGKQKVTTDGMAPMFGPLIVGRANGNIEIYEWTGSASAVEAPQAWVLRKTLSGLIPSKVDSLALTLRCPVDLRGDDIPSISHLRLFSTGGGSELIEWDMVHTTIRRSISSQGGSIWSIATNPASTVLALGCEDGSVHLLSLEYDTLRHLRRLDRSKSRILTLAWGPPFLRGSRDRVPTTHDQDDSSDEDEDEWQDSWIVAGCSDSSLRKWDVSSGRILDRMGTDKVKGERTLVWAVGVLGDGTIISGDSLGMVKFWDSRTCTQLQSFEAHGADVLCLVIGSEGTSVYTSGIDQKVSQFSLIKSSSKSDPISSSDTKWVRTVTKRMHSHDVRGFTTRIINPLATSVTATFGDAYHRRIAYSSGVHGTVGLHLAKGARLVLSTGDTGLAVWRLPEKVSVKEDSELAPIGKIHGWNKVLEMDLQVQTNLVASAISDDGRWLAVSDAFETKLFLLRTESSIDLKPVRVRDFQTILRERLPDAPSTCGASALLFSPDCSKLIVATTTGCVLVLDLVSDPVSARVLRRFDQHRSRNSSVEGRALTGRRNGVDYEADVLEPGQDVHDSDSGTDDIDVWPTHSGSLPATITRMAVSPDGQWLATTDDHMRTHIFNLDSVQHHSSLPSFPQPAHALAFAPNSPSLLILGFANNSIEVYDVEVRQFPAWSRGLCAGLPKRFTHLHDAILGVTLAPADSTTDQRSENFWGATWLCKVQFDAPVGWGGFEKKRRRRRSEAAERDRGAAHNFKLITQYRQILLAEFLTTGELVVVERPLTDVLAGLPPPYFKPKYGAS
ncbi:WD40 repeat-like protein [Lactarius deliciosus]|nr:WD40 repeat-like protein [Lactarius deliciosus]